MTKKKKDAVPAAPEVMSGNDEATQNRERLNYQCFLLDHWREFCRSPKTAKGYGKRFTCVIGSPSDLTQKLTSGKGREDFLNLTTAQIASLMPKIKLFVIPLKPNGNPKSGVGKEVKFSTFYNESTIADITSDKRTRGDACGLKSLSYELYDAGSTELASQRQKIVMKFYGESLHALADAGALDLAIQSEKYISEYDENGQLIPGREKPNSSYSALKLIYGWAIPPAENDMFTRSQRGAIKASTQSLILTLTDHTLSFNENGSVELECEYEGYVEAKLSELEQNILWPSKDATAEKEKAELALEKTKAKGAEMKEKAATAAKEAKKNPSSSFNPVRTDEEVLADQAAERSEKWKEIRDNEEKKLKAAIAIDKGSRYSRVMDELAKSNRIFSVKVKAEKLGLIGNLGNWGSDREVKAPPGSTMHPTAEQVANMSKEEKAKHDANQAKAAAAAEAEPQPEIKQKTGSDAADKATPAIRAHAEGTSESAKGDEDGKEDAQDALTDFSQSNLAATKSDEVEIEFMYYGDILNVVLKSAYDGKEVPINYLVGPLNFRDPRTSKWETICIADIPISLNLFAEFWMKNVVAAGRETYSIKQFLFQSAKELIVVALGDSCFPHLGRANTNPAGISITTFNAPALQGGHPRVQKGGKISAEKIPILGSTENATSKNHHEYVYIYCSAWTSKNLGGNRAKDAERGIYHVAVGQDRGPVKKVAFEKTDIQFQRTAAAMRGGGIDRLAAMYNANLTMVGNAMFMPGNYVFVAPTSMGMSNHMASRLGLGGYYTITKLTGVVDSGGWTSDIKCTPLFTSSTDRAQSAKGRAGVQPVTKTNAAAPSEPSPENKPK